MSEDKIKNEQQLKIERLGALVTDEREKNYDSRATIKYLKDGLKKNSWRYWWTITWVAIVTFIISFILVFVILEDRPSEYRKAKIAEQVKIVEAHAIARQNEIIMESFTSEDAYFEYLRITADE